ncbi:cyclin-dependent protein kinase inhibitor SMR3-like [Lotus japonicus]|uniref:cyclin-dependent protein kinase inhibitor SMR3-like n=1 Tax=Lotus japonicus TaxID=34305 RepID=UPI00258B794A|nr:cyclin-dependent protein kinase inhibitor SMR3-like [Lotus japonicus]
MATDLHLQHELPKLRISATVDDNDTISSSDSSSPSTPIAATASVPDSEIDDDAAVGGTIQGAEQSYRTPTSKESKIPAILNCPPAPKKPKTFVSCKRKLNDAFQFFEVKNKEDMDAFFRSTFPKRTCPCT